jgi:hypothetical protein
VWWRLAWIGSLIQDDGPTVRRAHQAKAINDQLLAQLDEVAAADSGATGSARDKARAMLDAGLTKAVAAVDKRLDDVLRLQPGMRDTATANATALKAHLTSIHDKAADELDKAEEARLDEMGSEAGALNARLNGDTKGERRMRLEAQITKRQAELDKEGGADADYFRPRADFGAMMERHGPALLTDLSLAAETQWPGSRACATPTSTGPRRAPCCRRRCGGWSARWRCRGPRRGSE